MNYPAGCPHSHPQGCRNRVCLRRCTLCADGPHGHVHCTVCGATRCHDVWWRLKDRADFVWHGMRYHPGNTPLKPTRFATVLWTNTGLYGGWPRLGVFEQEDGRRFTAVSLDIDSGNAVHRWAYQRFTGNIGPLWTAGFPVWGALAREVIEEPLLTLHVRHHRIVEGMTPQWAMYPPRDAWPPQVWVDA